MTSHPMEQRIQRKMDALELLGSWGLQRPDDDADGYDIDDGEPPATDPVSDVCRWDREVIEIWREHGGIPLDRSTVEYAWTLIRKLVAENDRLLAELAEPCNCDDTPPCDWCPEPATWVRRGVSFDFHGCPDHPVNKLGWERL